MEESVPMAEAISVTHAVATKRADSMKVPIPAYICLACGSVYEDVAASKVAHDDTNPAHKDCECTTLTKIDARTLKFDEAGNVIGAVRL